MRHDESLERRSAGWRTTSSSMVGCGRPENGSKARSVEPVGAAREPQESRGLGSLADKLRAAMNPQKKTTS